VGPEADLWALGCIIYQMLVGKAPFRGASEYLTFERIASGKLRIPPGVDAHAADAIKRLLRPEPAKRLGTFERAPAGDWSFCSRALQAY
jgi:3-phosphoinositide dependent protein kinase-1